LLLTAAPLALTAGMAQGQATEVAPATAAPAAAAPPPTTMQEIIVTGTSRSRSQLRTPAAVSTIDRASLQRLTAAGQADILNTLPAIKAEGGGGEVAANVFVKGLPSSGQYQFTPLEYDGIPVFSTFGLNSSAYDVYYRNDLGLERLEYVQGGVSNLFGPGSVAGIINFLTATGNDNQKNQIQAEVSDQNRVRVDVASSGPVPYLNHIYYAVSGYYRYDEGSLKTGDIARGFQVRGNLKDKFADGSGSATVYAQYIDDSVPFYSPLPLNGTTHKELNGNDGSKVQTVDTSAVDGLSYNTPEGMFHTKIGQGVYTNGGSLALVADKSFGDGWAVNLKAKTAHYDTDFNYFLGGDGKFNSPETQSQYLTDRGLPSNGVFTDAVTGQTLASSAVLFANRFQDRYRNATDSSLELNLKKSLSTGDITHTITLGSFFSRSQAADIDITTAFLGQFNNNPRLVDLTVTKPGGGQEIISENGLTGSNGYTNNHALATREAVYLADQMEFGKFVLDIGVRDESIQGTEDHELTSTQVTNPNPLLAPALQSVVWGDGVHQHGHVGTNQYAIAAGLLYRWTPEVSLYVNGARGYFFPQLNSVTFSKAGAIQSYAGEIIYQTQGGVKFTQGIFSGSLSGFYTELDNLENVLFVNNPNGDGSLIQLTQTISTQAYGLESELNVRLTDDIKFTSNMTLQNPTYTAYQSEPLVVGNQLLRQPKVLFNLGVYYNHGPFDAALYTNYTGTDYTAETNTIQLTDYYLTSLDAGYKPIDNARISLHIFNLFDSQGVSEGNPRQLNQTATTYFVGRPVLPRRISIKASYQF
jgi:outer membrane receptor protein involved in Fe transport